MVDNSYNETLNKAVEAFRQLDVNHDGQISSEEIELVMTQSGIPISSQEIFEIIQKLDVDHSGSVNFKEFLNYFRGSSNTKMSKTALWAAFKANDEDGNGMISRSKAREIFHDLGVEVNEEQIECFFKILDPYHCGICNYQEFEDTDIPVDWLF